MEEVTLKDVLNVVVEMKQEMLEMKQEQQEMKQKMIEMDEKIDRNFEETQNMILKLQEDVTIEIKTIVDRIGEDEARIRKIEERENNSKKTKGKILIYEGKNE